MRVLNVLPSAVPILTVALLESNDNVDTPATETVPMLSIWPRSFTDIVGTKEALPYLPEVTPELV